MKILHVIGGGDVGGAKPAVISLLSRISKSCTIKLVSFRSGVFSEEAENAGIDTEVIEIKNLHSDFKRLLAVCDEFKPDIIHSHGARGNLMGVMLKKKRKLPLVTTLHSDYKRDYMGRSIVGKLYGLINSCMLRFVDYYTCVSDKTARLMISRGFDTQSMFVIYNGIDFDGGYELRDRAGYLKSLGCEYNEGDVVVGIAARLTAVKNVSSLIKALNIALEKAPQLRLVIAGDGEEREMLESLAKELDISDRVTFAGWIGNIREFLAAIDINVICSLSEAFPYSILEGIREKCATVVTRVGGLPEVVSDNIDGFVVEPGFPEYLAERLVRYANNDDLRKTYARRLYEKASKMCSLDKMASDQLEIYNTVMRRFPKKKQRNGVTICGAYGKGNAGDDAILDAIIGELRSVDRDLPICVMSKDPKATKLKYRVDAIFTFNLPAIIYKFSRSKLYINGGGSLIQDITSTRSLYFYLWTLWTAKKVGCKVMMYGCGIGPVRIERNRELSASVINSSVDVITLREDGSALELKRMGIDKPEIILAADPALTLTPASRLMIRKVMAEERIPFDGKYLCLCMRPWEGYEEITDAIAAAADYALEKYKMKTVILPIELPRDSDAGQMIADKMKSKPYMVKKRYDSAITIGIISRMAAVMGMRLHSLVFASNVEVPVAGLMYDMKVEGFMNYIGKDLYCELSEVTYEKLCEFIDKMESCDGVALKDNIDQLRVLEKENINAAKRLLGY